MVVERVIQFFIEIVPLFFKYLFQDLLLAPQFLTGFITLLILYSIFFIKNTFSSKVDDSIVDVLWGVNAIVFSAIFFLFSAPVYINFVLFFVLSLWGYRLLFNILYKKNNNGGVEDKRYTDLKKSWNPKFYNVQRFFKIYFIQLVFGALMLLPVMIFMQYTSFYSELQDMIFRLGIFVLGIGLFIETLADLQLKDFIKHRKSKDKTFCEEGLWAYSRHPNYFGESLFWLGIAIVLSTQTLFGFLSWIFITYLLLQVSGIPLAERGFKNNKEYQKYKKRVSPFMIWFRKKER